MEKNYSKEDRSVENGNVVLFQRKNSKVWQARLRRHSGTWITKSTGESDFDKAKASASGMYKQMIWRQENNEVDVTKKFKDVAELTKRLLQGELNSGTGKDVYRHYIKAIDNYLIPALGNYDVHRIDSEKLTKLAQYRQNKLGKVPRSSTINTHNSALNRVFATAVDKGYMLKIQVPTPTNKGTKAKSRPYFSNEEYKRVARNLREWSKTGHQKKTREIRELLRDYVAILKNTGIRHSTEALSLRWNNIRYTKIEQKFGEHPPERQGIELSVEGKRGRRKLIAINADGNVSKPLKRIQNRFPSLTSLSNSELFKQTDFVFRLPDGNLVEAERLAKNFKIFLEKYDLLTDTAGENRTLYSLRHTYATLAILDGVEMAVLAEQMGTSIGMLERHYSKLKPYMKAGQLGGYEKKASKLLEKESYGLDRKIEDLTAQVKQLGEVITKQSKTIESQQRIIEKLTKI